MFLIEYFLKNRQLNYVLMAFLFALGIHAYITIPKEMFPEVTLDKIVISGGYSGASAANLDYMAVRDIEEGLDAVTGIRETETTIKPGSFGILLTLEDGADSGEMLDQVKDAIAKTRRNLPSDMTEPTASAIVRSKTLIRISVSSDTLERGELIAVANDVKSKIAKRPNVTEVDVRGDADERVEIRINPNALKAFNLDPSSVTSAIAALSYTFPIGEIEERGNFVYVSTIHGKSDATSWADTVLKIGNRYVRLDDIADVEIYYPQEGTRSNFNGEKTLTLKVNKDSAGNAIAMVEDIRSYIKEISPLYPEVSFDFFYDSSKPLKGRLDTILSNLFLGLILVFVTMYYLINFRTALVVTIGVPFAFIIGLLFLYYAGYSLNLVSLLGALIVIGIVVDDAIVVSENIQRHLDEGMEHTQAVLTGTKEMLFPVTVATITTIFAFAPMFTLSAEIGKFISLIPVVVVLVLLGSLIESFLFLPLHSKELLKPKTKHFNWTPIMNVYERLLHGLIRYKKLSLTLFLILIPVATVFTAKSMHFQFFPRFDGTSVYLSGKLPSSTPIAQTEIYTKSLEKEIMKYKEKYSIRIISTTVGWRRNLVGESESGESVFYMTLELADMKEENWVNRYLTPILSFSFDFNDPSKVRTLHSYEVARMLSEEMEPLKEKFELEELGVVADRPGVVRSDIKINLVGATNEALEAGVNRLQKSLESIKGVKDIGNNIRYGKEEYKIKVNRYGEELGLSETQIARILNKYYLANRQAMTFNDRGVVEVVTETATKYDRESFKNFDIPLGDGRYIALHEVCEFVVVRDYEKVEKVDGEIIKTVYANVSPKLITASEVINQLRPLFKEFESQGIGVRIKGEEEKNRQLQSEMSLALFVALSLMLIVLLLIFPKIKYALMIVSVIPFSFLGALLGHIIMDMNLTMPSVIGILGLAGVVINDGIIMLSFLHGTRDTDAFYERAKLRVRPILITTITTFVGLATLIFYATGQAVILQPLAISLGFGLIWGTVLNLFYLPTLYAVINKINPERNTL